MVVTGSPESGTADLDGKRRQQEYGKEGRQRSALIGFGAISDESRN
jgi:hypothetical protein